jgi:hypothetical protein
VHHTHIPTENTVLWKATTTTVQYLIYRYTYANPARRCRYVETYALNYIVGSLLVVRISYRVSGIIIIWPKTDSEVFAQSLTPYSWSMLQCYRTRYRTNDLTHVTTDVDQLLVRQGQMLAWADACLLGRCRFFKDVGRCLGMMQMQIKRCCTDCTGRYVGARRNTGPDSFLSNEQENTTAQRNVLNE